MNECTTGHNDCEQNCNNIEGSYACSCDDGYVLNQDGFHCSGIHIIKYSYIDRKIAYRLL